MDYKSGQVDGLHIGASMDYKSGQVEGLHIGAKGLQNGAGITNRGKKITNWGRDYKSGQGLQIGAAQLQHCLLHLSYTECQIKEQQWIDSHAKTCQ